MSDSSSTRILVVEDSSTQARMLKVILEGAGFEVETASDGESGLERFKESHFDLVLSDVMMPGMSGYELCKKIKASSGGKSAPVVLLTALTELKDLVEGLRSGADNFITKPYEPSYLITRVHSIVHNNNVTAGPGCDPESGVCLMDKSFLVNLDKKRILDYLVSTFDDYFRSRQRESDAKLIEAQHRLRSAEEKEAFLSELSKGLKAPLQGIEQEFELLMDGTYGSVTVRQMEVLQELQRSNRAILELMDNLFHGYRACA